MHMSGFAVNLRCRSHTALCKMHFRSCAVLHDYQSIKCENVQYKQSVLSEYFVLEGKEYFAQNCK